MKICTLVGLGAVFCAAIMFSPSRAEPPRRDDVQADKGSVKLVGDKGDVENLVKADVAELQKLLSEAKPEKKKIKQARVLAVVIAMNAEALGGDSAAVRDQAAKVAEALAKDDGLKEAKEAAKGLTTVKTPSGAHGDPIKTLFDDDPNVRDWDRDLIMQLFKTPRAGGLGIESKVKAWAEKAPVGKDMDLAATYAQKCAVVGQVLQRINQPKGKPISEADWKKYAADMSAAADEAMKAAKSKDGKAVMNAFGKVDKACTVCHEKAK